MRTISDELDSPKPKTARPKPEKILFGDMESMEGIAQKIIKDHHPELLSAKIMYRCRSKATKRAGAPVPGNVGKIPLKFQDKLNDCDFWIEVALDVWNDLGPKQREALVDHLLTRCVGQEDEDTGEMKWSVQPPRVQEFPEVVARYGEWNDDLVDMSRSLNKS